MSIRTAIPSKGNKFYNTVAKGGYSKCIVGNPVNSGCNVLANCVGYACGRFNEVIGKMKYPNLNCNAENFIERAKSYGLTVLNQPTQYGIMVWQKGKTLSGKDGVGHVAIAEKIIDSNTIYTSESSYTGKYFFNSTRKNTNKRWGAGSSYTFRGCIVNPVSIKKVVANGGLHMRESAKLSAKSISLIPNGKVVYILDDTKINSNGYTWNKVYYNNKIGYVAIKYLK